MVKPGIAESIKVISYDASKRIARYAFDYARKHDRKRVLYKIPLTFHLSLIHRLHQSTWLTCKPRLMDYLFNLAPRLLPNIPILSIKRRPWPMCAWVYLTFSHLHSLSSPKLAADPTKFDVMVLPNLYGDVVSDMCAGLLGGLGLTPSGNIGADTAIFEAVHGTAPVCLS